MATGISPRVYNHLREVLSSCWQFERQENLRALFVDIRLTPWRDEIPDGGNVSERVNLIIDFLSQRYETEANKNALVLLLQVLCEQTSVRDSLHQDLKRLVDQLTRELVKQPLPGVEGKLVYDLQQQQDFSEWSGTSTTYGFEERIGCFYRDSDAAFTYRIRALSTESVGVNKPLRWIFGKAEFEYQVLYADRNNSHVYFCVIPMQQTNIGRTGLIEVGSDVQADPKNPFSPYRRRFYIPIEHYGDGEWHRGSITFDFRDTATAFYSIFAPRINEGCLEPKPASLLISKLRVFSLE